MRSLTYLSALLPFVSLSVNGYTPEQDTTVVVTTTRTVTICPIVDLFTCMPDVEDGWGDWNTETSAKPTTKSGDDHVTTTKDGPTTEKDKPTTYTIPTGIITYTTTDKDGKPTTYTGPTGPGTYTTTDKDGKPTTFTIPTGGVYTTTDKDGKTTTYTVPTGTDTYTIPTGGEYTTTDKDGNPTTYTVPTGGTYTTTDKDGNPTTYTVPTGGVYTTTGKDGKPTTYTLPGQTTTTTTGTDTTSTGTSTTESTCGGTKTAVPVLKEGSCNDASDRSKWCGGKSVNSDTHDSYVSGETKTFNLVISKASIDFDGVAQPAFAINGKTPGEAIEVNWGDMVVVTVTNNLPDNATTIHWHGVRQFGTNDQDGVPGVTECGIAPGSTRTYTWLASTYGTGWYHSHTLSQYGGGIRGPIIIHGPASANYDLDMGSIMINEKWNRTIFEMAYTIARTAGQLPPATNYLLNGKNLALDGKSGEASRWIVKSGKKHLFRIINSSAQSGYAVHFDNHKMTVISADFTPITPYQTEWLWIQSGQRYNVIVEMDQPEGAYWLRAVTQTGCGVNCQNTGLGNSNGIFEYEKSCTATPASSNVTVTLTGICQDEPLASLNPIVSKGAGSSDKLAASAKLLPAGNAGIQNFGTAGNIVRWFFGPQDSLDTNSPTKLGNATVMVDFEQPTLQTLATMPDLAYNSTLYSNVAVLDGQANDWVYFVIQNNFQTSHPMHLHGHDFSVLGQGTGIFNSGMIGSLRFDNPIRRDTALLFGAPQGPPGPGVPVIPGWTVIGFQTDNPGAWLMHCHIIWHADGGMGLQFIEQPKDINANKYYSNPEFQGECSTLKAYKDAGNDLKASYESGLKRRVFEPRHLEDHKFHGYAHGNVVRKN